MSYVAPLSILTCKTIENVERIINGVVQKMIESNQFSNGAKSVVDRMNINWN